MGDGVVEANVPNAVYHARRLGVVSKSALDWLDGKSPAHYKAWVDGLIAEEETPALAFGSAFHCALLEPERFALEYATEPNFGDCRRKEPKQARAAWVSANAGKRSLSPEDAATIAGMVASVKAHPLASRILRDGQAELTVKWQDYATGVQCKCRADYYVPRLRMVADVKSTTDASRDGFRRDVARYSYHVQDALYRAGFNAVGKQVDHFVFVSVEKTVPYAVATYSLDMPSVNRGYTAARRGIEKMAECLASGVWPGYPTEIQEVDVPPWAS